MNPVIHVASAAIVIGAPIHKVWDALINPEMIKQYMYGTKVNSDWKQGSAIVWSGDWQGKTYEDKGKILKIEKEHILQYSYFSPLEGKPDIPENYSVVTIELIEISADAARTSVTFWQDNIESEEVREHIKENWRMILTDLKRLLEKK